ncbi:unnamed protein product [Lactuca saligna]|uniref:Uncharacterized protein n=1 Tax=Lactuca saligna TaxID=75948 RepID=A0AA36E561_LACSI|nr:unnamed protein product [Lactuca saligna]
MDRLVPPSVEPQHQSMTRMRAANCHCYLVAATAGELERGYRFCSIIGRYCHLRGSLSFVEYHHVGGCFRGPSKMHRGRYPSPPLLATGEVENYEDNHHGRRPWWYRHALPPATISGEIMKRKNQTTTVWWWLPPPATVSGGGVLSCVGIAGLGCLDMGLKP